MTPTLAQIQGWLKKPEVWRFLGFASTVVGVLCQALSSSFNHVIGGWNLLKIILYSVFGLIICVAVLSVKAWRQSPSLRFKAHVAFVVLTITSVYSFFFDKRVRKPDAYSLISCAAFAMMSLSLSRQRQVPCGFEVDLLYFFLSFLLMQLLKIKLLLGSVGVVFSFVLIILRSSLDGLPENADLESEDQNHVAIEMDSPHSNNGGGALFITNQQANTDSAPLMNSSHAPPPNNSDVTMQGFMHILDEIRQTNPSVVNMLCKSLRKYLEDMGRLPLALMEDPNYVVDALPSNLINDLRDKVKLMVARGFEKECSDEYSRWRREFLQECLLGFGLNNLNSKEVDEKKRIKNWIKLSNIALSILFPFERTLCDRIFLGFPSVADPSFMQVCSEVMSILLNFANASVSGSPSLNLLPSILLSYRTLSQLLAEISYMFSDQYCATLRTEAIRTCWRLGQASDHLFMELKNLVYRDMKQRKFFGGLCPITEEVMEYLSVVPELECYPHAAEVTKIVELLDVYLEAKFKDYTSLRRGFERRPILYKLKIILGIFRTLQRTVAENHEHNERSILMDLFGSSPHRSYEEPLDTVLREFCDRNELCPICLTNGRDMAFGCNHMSCSECGSELDNCPMCNAAITTRIKLLWL